MSARLFVAIDTPDAAAAASSASRLLLPGLGVKLGLEFFTANGVQGLLAVRAAAQGIPIFLDLKFHDIPNTVAGAVRSVIGMAPAFITIHASGGKAMMEAAVKEAEKAAASSGVARPKILAVTVLTSMDDSDLDAVGMRVPAQEQVLRLASLAKDAGVDGIVCSAKEVSSFAQCSCDTRGHESSMVLPLSDRADSIGVGSRSHPHGPRDPAGGWRGRRSKASSDTEGNSRCR